MKKNYIQLFLTVLAFLFVGTRLTSQVTQTYSYTGSLQTFVVPSCVSQITIDMAGASGANAIDVNPTNSTGGKGGRIMGVLTVTPGQLFNIYIGSAGNATTGAGGYNGGGAGGQASAGSSCNGGFAGGGGGASDIRIGGITLLDRVLVAAGGGGAGRDYCNGSCQPCGCGGSGGAGGGLTGINGVAAYNCGFSYPGTGVNGGGGGGSNAGGFAGLLDGTNGPSGNAGTLGVGGSGAGGSYDVAGGGGGGGYYGGGGGGSAGSGSGVAGGGGGGGSSYLGTMTSAVTTPSYQQGNGYLILTYNVIGGFVTLVPSNTLVCSGSNVNLNTTGTVLSYTWSNGSNASNISVSPTTNTIYTVSSTNSGGCISNSSVALVVNTNPTVSINTLTNNICLGKTAILTATGANTYTWSNSLSTTTISVSPNVTTTYSVSGQNACGTVSAAITITVAPLAVTVISNPTIVCAGSTATLNAAAAANAYTWSPVSANGSSIVVSPIVNTIYTVAVSDGTCAGIGTVGLVAKPVPTITAVPTITTVCGGVPVNFTASGGTSYTWTPGNLTGASITVAPMAPTGYQVIGSNSLGCTSIANVVVIAIPSPTLNPSANTNFVCAGDPVNLTSQTGYSSYLWSNGASTSSVTVNPTITTTYSVTGTNTTGCSTTETVMVTVFAPLLTISGPTAICNGATATLTASGANSYVWSNGFTSPAIQVNPSTTTIYNLSALTTSSGINCPSTASVQLLVLANPTVTAVSSKTAICKAETTTLTASGASSYSWNTSATTSSIVITSSLVTTLTYSVIGTSTNGCNSKTTVQVKINSCTGLSELIGGSHELKIYPNPSIGEFNIEFDSEIKLNLVNELGQLIKVCNLNAANDFKIHVTGLSSGVYFINNISGGKTINQKVIVR